MVGLDFERGMTEATVPVDIAPGRTRVGWIGTGQMGAAMAGHILAAGYELIVFNRSRRKAEGLISNGAKYAETPQSVTRQSDVVFTMVSYPADVRALALGEKGILEGLREGGIFVDMTTSDPALAQEIYDVAKRRLVEAVDAPVSGGDKGAKDGTLAVMAGGQRETVEILQPLFSAMGSCKYVGPPGSGQNAKLANQIMMASNMVALVEGAMYARKSGLDLKTYKEAVSGSEGWSKAAELFMDRLHCRDFSPGGNFFYIVKDTGIALKRCQDMHLSLPGVALAQQLFISLMNYGEEKLGIQALMLSLERLNNL